jgi:hypothetical protein
MTETRVLGLRFPRKFLLLLAVLAALFFAAFPVTAYYLVGGDGMTIESSGAVGEQSLSLNSVSHTFIIERYAGSVARASAVNFLISTLQIAVAASGIIGVMVIIFTKNMLLGLQAAVITIIAVAIINIFALFF